MRVSSSLLFLGALSSLILGCQRSAGFKKDQGYYHDEAPSYYSKSGSGKSSTDRFEQMGQPKKRVMVLDFFNDTPVHATDLGSFAADELKKGLYITQRMVVPTDVKSDLGTADFIQGDRVRVAQLIREGRRLGVTVLIIGRISKVVFRQKGDEIGLFRQKQSLAAVDVEAKVFDVSAGREIVSLGKSGEASNNSLVALEGTNTDNVEFRNELTRLAVRNAIGILVPDVMKSVEKMTWEGRVAKILGNKIYVNAGKASGLVAGDILRVLTQGQEVFDPSTGAYLGRTPGQLKGTVEVTDFIGTDGAVSELHTGGNVQEGDTVRLY